MVFLDTYGFEIVVLLRQTGHAPRVGVFCVLIALVLAAGRTVCALHIPVLKCEQLCRTIPRNRPIFSVSHTARLQLTFVAREA